MSDSDSKELAVKIEKKEPKEELKETKKRKKRTRGSKKQKKKEESIENTHGITEKGEKIFSLFLSGLPYETNEEQIREFLGNPDSITHILLPEYQDTGRCIGYSHVEFNRKKDFEHGLTLDKTNLGGRYIDVSISKGKNNKQTVRSKDPPADCRTIFVGNLPFDITEDQVGDKFRKFGEIDQVRFAINYSNKKFKGRRRA